MPFDYEISPTTIEQESFKQIRTLCDFSGLSKEETQVAMRIVHSLGMPHLAKQVHFSQNACISGMRALQDSRPILCDVEMVKQGVTKRMINDAPLCFLNNQKTVQRAKSLSETRSMAALEQWRPFLKNSIVLIGNAPTALFRLLEMLEQGADKPAVVIGMPVGFVGAQESKHALWEHYAQLNIECITLLGREGGSAVTAATCNALLRCIRGEYY